MRDRGDGAIVLELVEGLLAPPQCRDPVLTGVNLRLGRGEIGVLLGANGSGKTTLLRTVAGLWPLRGGRMIPEAGGRYDLSRAGLLLDDPFSQLTAATVAGEVEFGLENLGWETAAIRERSREMLSGLGLSELVEADPGILSPGEQERVLVAAALAPGPPLLLLDDPFLYLGPEEAREAWGAVVAQVRSGRVGALLWAGHETEPVADADYVGVLQEGRLAWGTPESHRTTPLPEGVAPWPGPSP